MMTAEIAQIITPMVEELPTTLKEDLLNLVDMGLCIQRSLRDMALHKDEAHPDSYRNTTQEIKLYLEEILHDLVTSAVKGVPLPYPKKQSYDIFIEN